MNSVFTGRQVLVVEDEMMILCMLEEMLSDLGLQTVAAATVNQALALLDTYAFDAAMLDVNLPCGKSYPIADRLAARGIPFFFLTGYSDVNAAYRERPVLHKPFRYTHLVEILARILAEPGACL